MGQNLVSVLCCHVFNLFDSGALNTFVFSVSSNAQGMLALAAVWSQSGSRRCWYSWRTLPIHNGAPQRNQSLSHFCSLQKPAVLGAVPWESPRWPTDTLYCLSNSPRKSILTNVMFIWNKQVYFSQEAALSQPLKYNFLFVTFFFPSNSAPFRSSSCILPQISFKGTISTDPSHKNSNQVMT